ncbi:MAG: hypothetical protein LBG82_08540 [Clostridiales Family XIII bacterium]|nr:hypothetical protein [Clostridiales Family XIII bacterium]
MLSEQNKILTQHLFGCKSEAKLIVDTEQLDLINEAKVVADKESAPHE